MKILWMSWKDRDHPLADIPVPDWAK